MMKASDETRGKQIIISADSHVEEGDDFWATRLPSSYREQAPRFSKRRETLEHKPGGYDPHERVKEMAVDGVSTEVLYPTRGISLFGLEDARLQEACFRAYNDWLIEYCQVAPKHLLGVSCISVYNIEHAVKELERCMKAGLKGALIWMVAPPELPLYSGHYDRFWAAAQELSAPVSLHVNTGRNPKESKHVQVSRNKAETLRRSINTKLSECVDALFDLIFYGVLERFPRLKIVLVEGEIGWIPFVLQRWDSRYRQVFENDAPPVTMNPSDYFNRQVYATFINDAIGGRILQGWGMENCMWSSDYPHTASYWPNSRKVIEQTLGHLPSETRGKLLCTNAAKLYNMEIPQLMQN